MNRVSLFFMVLLGVIACGKVQSIQPFSSDDWAPDVKDALNSFIDIYRHSENAYAVFDFDNTTAIFDIEDQLAIHQLKTMSFAVDSAGLRAAISAGLNTSESECAKWIDDICTAYGILIRKYGPFTPAGLDEAMLLKVQSDPQWMEFATKMRGMYDKVAQWTSEHESYNWVLYWFTGMTDKQVYDLAYASHKCYSRVETSVETWTSPAEIQSRMGQVSCEWTSGVQVTDALKELWKVLDDNGIDVWVCSASGLPQVTAAIDAFGLHSSCTGAIAMTIAKDSEGHYIPEYDFVSGCAMRSASDGWQKDTLPVGIQPVGPGKVTAILNAIAPHYDGATPIAGFMDSTGDFNFCTEFSSLKLVVCFNRADRKITDGGGLIAEIAMYEKDALGYTFDRADSLGDTMYLLQGRDENGLRSLRPSNKTIRYGAAEEKLFAGEDNFKQLQEITARDLSVKEAIDEYCKLFLDSYNGYHSR